MNKITLENINKRYPSTFNFDKIVKNDLGTAEGVNDLYIELVNKYKSFFEKYLLEELPLKEYDDRIKNSKLGFDAILEDEMDYYQRTSTMNLSYLYLRNNMNIENLNSDELNFLKNHNEYNDDVKKFISNSFKTVIRPYDDNTILFYGPEGQKWMCDPEELVFGLRYNEFSSKNDNQMEEYFNREKFITKLCGEMNVVFFLHLDETDLRCINYNSVSIMEKYDEE